MNFSSNKGFSLIELLVIIVILILISLVVMPSLIDFQREQALKNTTENIVSLLNKAKSDTLSSLNSTTYGVHFESKKMVYFEGDSYSSGNSNNQEIPFESGVEIPSGGINLSNGGSDVVFPRLTGEVNGYGTITIELTALSTRQKVITINKIGSISSS